MELLKYLAFFISVIIVNGVNGDQIAPGCEDKVMDVYFLLDASNSIWIEHYRELTPFVQNVVSELDIGATKTRVGVSSFSNTTQPAPLRLNRFNDKEILKNYITMDNIPYLTGITNISRAIKYVRENRDFREDSVKVIVVATDGISSSRQQTAYESDAARWRGFYLFVVGFGLQQDDQVWKRIANDPDEDFIHLVSSTGNDYHYRPGSFNRAKSWLISKICVLQPAQSMPEALCNVDGVYASLYFITGSGASLNFTYDISRDFVRGVSGNDEDVKVGYRLPACSNTGLPLGSAEDYCRRVRYSPEMSLSDQLERAITVAREAVFDRGDHNKVAVIVVDDLTLQLISETNIGGLKDHFDVILIDLSGEGVSRQIRNELKDPLNYIPFTPEFSDYQQFLKSFGARICEGMKRQESVEGPTPSK